MDDASLDDFLDDRSGTEDDPAATDGTTPDREPQEPDSDGQPGDLDAVEPATSTYSWHGDTATCAHCGTAVGRRWRDGEQLVCRDCKEW